MRQRFLVLVEKGETSYGAYSPDVPGCVAVGDTEEETLELMQEALQAHIEGMVQDGDPIPNAGYVNALFLEIDVSTPATATA
jgi:predicted RNase H-like HicB family nuclease